MKYHKPKYIRDLENAELSDLSDFDIDSIVKSENRADDLYYCKIFRDFSNINDIKDLHKSLIEMLIEVMKMKISLDTNGSMFVSRTNLISKRSAKSDDLSNKNLLKVIRFFAKKTEHLIIKTRLEHLSWDIDRSDWKSGRRAIFGYLKIICGIKEKKYIYRRNEPIVSVETRDILDAAIGIFRNLRPRKDIRNDIESVVIDIFDLACKSSNINSIIMFGKIASEFDNYHVVDSLTKFFAKDTINNCQQKANLLKLLAEEYLKTGNDKKYNFCKIEEARVYSFMADSHLSEDGGSAAIAEGYIEKAISILNNIPEEKTATNNLLRKLEGARLCASKELIPISAPINLEELQRQAESYICSDNLNDALLKFANLDLSVEAIDLLKIAHKIVSEFPISAAFGSVLKAEDGRTQAKTREAATMDDDGPVGNFEPTIAQYECYRRAEQTLGIIEICRNSISKKYRVSKKKIYRLLQSCRNVPPHYRATLSDGFERYFGGDMLGSTYILFPLLEEVIRQALIVNDHHFGDISSRQSREIRTSSMSQLIRARESELTNIYGEANFQDIRRVFLSEWGPSVRHGTSHALLSNRFPYSVDASYACWLIWKLCVCQFQMETDRYAG